MNLTETFKMALSAISANKLRSALTLVGIIAGVASIIAVMTGISVIQKTMEKEMSVLGSTTFQVQKFLNGPSTAEERRKAQQRRPVTVEQANAIRERVGSVDLVGAELWDFGFKAKYGKHSTNSNLTICGGTPEYPANNTHYVVAGRNLSHEDIKVGRRVVVIGHAVAEELFPFRDPIDRERTREIGIRKAIGAKRRAILSQFLFESSTICLIGGVIGLLLAFGVTALISKFVMPASISLPIVVVAILVSILTGIVSGFIPAYKAAKLNPIEALRYE